jgi:hypothetical protein
MLAQPIFKKDWLYATAINEDHVDVSNGDLALVALLYNKLDWTIKQVKTCQFYSISC